MQNVRLLSAWIPVVSGVLLFFLFCNKGAGSLALIFLPAVFLVGGGMRCLLFADMRAPQIVAMGSVLSLVFSLPIGFVCGLASGLTVLLLGLLSFIAGGWFQLKMQPVIDGVPAPSPTPIYSAKVAIDDVMLGFMAALTPPATKDLLKASVAEVEKVHAFFREQGYLANPRSYHIAPPAPENVDITKLRLGGLDCEHIQFESGYEPRPEMPGGERWLQYAENRTCHAWVFRQDRPGPWLLCVHGFGMGDPKKDMGVFKVAELYRKAGLNLVLVALPVHGPRSPGGFSGEQFFGSSAVDFIHAETQAVWDLRRVIAWVRQQGATQLGVYGISLGGYTSSVLAGVEEGLSCLIAGVPPTDMIAHKEYLASSIECRVAASAGVDPDKEKEIYRVVSPLVLEPLVSQDRRYMYGATGDQFVPIEQVHALWQHWQQPRICWATGGHMSALMQKDPKKLVEDAVAECFGLNLS